jgi:hypothetical protein
MEQLIKTLPAVLKAGGHSEEVIEAAAIAAWKHVAGELLNTQARAISLKSRTLQVAVSDAIWQKQLEVMKGQLVFRINSVLGQPLVGRLEFTINQSLVAHDSGSKEKVSACTDDKDVPLELWSAATAIKDNELRKTFLATAARSLKRTEQKS